MTLSLRAWQRPLAALLVGLLVPLPPAAAQDVAESAASVEAFSIGDVVPSLPAAAVGLGATNAVKGRSAPVSARGTFSTSIPIQVPPGRLGMTPSLVLVYDSGAFRQDSAMGAGWTLAAPRIVRSTLYGFPKLKRTADALVYDDAEARFEAQGGELGKLPAGVAVPPKLFADGVFYAPLRETAPIVYEYSAGQGAWVERRPDGVKRHYGLEGTRKARIQNELGTFAWLLLKETDRHGNGIRYEYHFIEGQDRADKYLAQQEPILRRVTWGGHGSDEPDPFRVVVKSANQIPHGAPDLMRGNTQATGAVSSIVVCGPSQLFTRASGADPLRAPSGDCTGSLYWSYALTLKASADTGRKLLTRVTRTNPWGDPERVWTFRYQSNGGKVKFGPAEPLVSGGDPEDQLLFTRYGNRLDLPLNSRDRAMNPSETSIGARFVDLNHDGRTDVVYHPSGIAAPEAGILREGTIDPPFNRFAPVDFDEFVRSRLRTEQGGWEAFDLPSLGFKEYLYLPDGRFRYSDLADVNGDGRVDAVFFNGSLGDGFPAGRRQKACFSEAFWSRCGVIDPPRPNICQVTNLCEQLAELDMTMCANGSCWITPTDLRNLFGDWADWLRTPPFTQEGQKALGDHGATIDVSQTLISVPAALLRARLKMTPVDRRARESAAFATAMSTPATCAGMMRLCTGESFDGIPAPRIGIDMDSTLVKLGRRRKSHTEMRVLPPEYRMNYHAGGGSPNAVAATIPLLGWPAAVYKLTVLVENPEPGPQEWTSRPGADFSAPLVDVNGDGLADLILLKSTEVTAATVLLPSTEFTPRAFLARRSPVASGGFPDVSMELDWKSFLDQYPDAAGEKPAGSDFTQSLQDILVKPGAPYCNTVDCVPENELTYPAGPNYNSFVLDLNGDGLPDLVAATPDPTGSCAGSGPPRHDVFLNRGYRFGIPAGGTTPGRPRAAAGFAAGPFELLLKRDLGGTNAPPECPAVTLGASLPMAAASFTDINGDGRLDVVFQWHAFGAQELSRRIFLNRGRYFEPLPGAAANSYGLPSVPMAEVKTNRPRGFSVGDLARLEDIDNDGLVDLVAAGTFCLKGDRHCAPFVHPDMPGPMAESRWRSVGTFKVLPAFVYRNTGKVPDLLTRIEESSGVYTDVAYAAGRTGPVTSSWVPPGLMVVSEVKRGAGQNSSEERVRLTYENYVKTADTPEALGFERVTALFEDRDGATVTSTLKQTRLFDVRPRVDGVNLAHPGKGLELETTSEADGRRESTSSSYAFLPYGEGVRIRSDRTDSLTCLLRTNGSCDPNDLAVTRTATATRDEFGFATEVLSGDVVNGEISATERVRAVTTYDHRTNLWALGNLASETVKGRSIDLDGNMTEDAQLSSWTAVYDAQARLTKVEQPAITPESCGHAVSAAAATIEVLSYDGRGLPTQVRTNGQRTATLTYDNHNLYALEQSVGVERYVDGVLQAGETTLVSHTERDLRTGEVWSSRDANGALVETQRDSFGRAKRLYDAKGAMVERNAYQDAAPVRQRKWLMTSGTGQGRYVETKLDGAGRVLARFESKWTGGQSSETIRMQAADYDSAGNLVREYLPKASTAMPAAGDLRIVRKFDGFGMLTRQQSPDGTAQGRVTVVTYGPRRTVSTDPRGTVTTHVDDWSGALTRLERTGGSESAVVRYERDGLGRLTSVTDADGAVRRFESDPAGRIYRYTLPHSATSPASGTFERCFDVSGVLVLSTDPTGGRVRVRYDKLDRPVVKEVDEEGVTSPSRYTYSYDAPETSRKAMGRLWRSTGPVGATEIGYDIRGFAVEGRYQPAATTLGGSGWPQQVKTTLQYGLQGELRRLSYRLGVDAGVPAGVFVYHRDARGRLKSVTEGSSTLATDFHYDAFQRMDRATLGAGITARWEWTAESQDLKRIEYQQGGATLVRIAREDFDKAGNPGKEKRTGQGLPVEKSHTFDGIARLKTSSLTVGGSVLKNETYEYSPGGRLLQAGADTYLYDKPSLSGAATSVGSRILDYDARGNVIRDASGDQRLRYDAQGCTAAIESAGGNRVAALCDAGGNHIFRSTQAGGVPSRVLKMGLSELRPDDGVLLHRLPLNGTISIEMAYRLTDGSQVAEQSRVVMLDSRGSVVAAAPVGEGTAQVSQAGDYEAWGGKVKLDPAEAPRHGFVGFEPDEAFGTYAFGQRVYDPSLRRWFSPDPLVAAAPEVDESDTRQLNLWSYAANNPVGVTDPQGTFGPFGVFVLGVTLVGVASIESDVDADISRVVGDPRPIIEDTKSFIEKPSARAVLPLAASLLTTIFLKVNFNKIAKGIDAFIDAKNAKKKAERAVDVVTEKPKMTSKERRAAEQARAKASKTGDPDYEEPASEGYAQAKAKELEKAEGKDARRKAHDEKGERGDRTQREIDDDYRKR